MRIIFLNTWKSKILTEIKDFVSSRSSETDIFCFQEVTPKNFEVFSKILGGFNGIFVLNVPGQGQSVFVKKNIQIISTEKINFYKQTGFDNGCLQKIGLVSNGKSFFVGSVHGMTLPGNKLDTASRIKQSKKIIEEFAKEKEPKIIGGDFNLDINIESVDLFEKSGFKNLIKDFKVGKTRSKLAWDFYKDTKGFVKQYFADYCFTSPEVKVNSFEVPNINISDHLPLVLDFEV